MLRQTKITTSCRDNEQNYSASRQQNQINKNTRKIRGCWLTYSSLFIDISLWNFGRFCQNSL